MGSDLLQRYLVNMKKIINRMCMLLEAKQSNDEIKSCLDIMLNGHTTEQSVYIMINVVMQFEGVLRQRLENNTKENESITKYLNR
jgi:hypothetical protein